jgi:DNA-binding LacI/PurR family transcriptional regulator
MKRVGFVACLPPGLHPGMDALAHGLSQALAEAEVELCLFPADLRGARGAAQAAAIESALAHDMQGIVLFVLDMQEPADRVAAALAQRIPVVAIHKPLYPVSAAIVVPNYHQGVILAQALARALTVAGSPRRRVAIVGGPSILDDIELVRGVVDGARAAGLELQNDPFEPRYRNLDDVRGAGRRAVENVLDDHYPFEGCVVFNDETHLDALEVFEARGLTGTFPSVSRNGSPLVIEQVRRGMIHATFDYHLPEIGLLAGRTLLACREPGAVPMDALIAAPVGDLFTLANVARYVPWQRRVHHGKLTHTE